MVTRIVKQILVASIGWGWLISMPPVLGQNASDSKATMIVVVGASGETKYGEQFAASAAAWSKVSKAANIEVSVIGTGTSEQTGDLDQLRKKLETLKQSEPADNALDTRPVWLILIGHGTFQSNIAKFNLRGPDLSAEQLAKWLDAVQRPLVVINTSSSSGPFVNSLSGERRTVVTATKSGEEQNFARFGLHLPEAIGNPKSDLDHDGEVSLLEAVLKASSDTKDFYVSEDRILTEHALLDDNGDKFGTPAEMLGLVLRGDEVRAAAKPKSKSTGQKPVADGDVAISTVLVLSSKVPDLLPEEKVRRAETEAEIRRLRRAKSSLDEGDYYAKLEALMVDLSKIYETAEKRKKTPLSSP